MHGKRINRCRANVIVHEVLRRAGFRNLNAYGTHSLRKTFCQAIYRITGNDLNLTRAIMGHADCSTTQRYLFVDETEMQNAVLNLARPRARSSRLAANVGDASATNVPQRWGGEGSWPGRVCQLMVNGRHGQSRGQSLLPGMRASPGGGVKVRAVAGRFPEGKSAAAAFFRLLRRRMLKCFRRPFAARTPYEK